MKIILVAFAVLVGTAHASGVSLCGKNEQDKATPAATIRVERGDSYTVSVTLISGSLTEVLDVTDEDDVHSGGRVSVLTLKNTSGSQSHATANWEELWIDGSTPAGIDFKSHLSQCDK